MGGYARGTQAVGECQRCGLKFLLRDLIFDGYYPNLRVCGGCYDGPQPQERLAIVSDPEALWKPAPQQYRVTEPFLTIVLSGGLPVLKWTSIMAGPPGEGGRANRGANLSSNYVVFRSIDGGLTWTKLATLPNTADEFGALSIETLTWTDLSPPGGLVSYRVLGNDVYEFAEYG